MIGNIAESLATTRRLLDHLDRRSEPVGPWRLEIHPSATSIESKGDLTMLATDLRAISPLLRSSRLVGSFAGASITFTLTPSGTFDLVAASSGELGESFGLEHIDAARDAWAGDFEAAARLPGTWRGEATIQPARLLDEAAPHIDWLVFGSPQEVGKHIASIPFWKTQELAAPGRLARFLVRGVSPNSRIRTIAVDVLSMDCSESSILDSLEANDRGAAPKNSLLRTAVSFEDLIPSSEVSLELAPIALSLGRLAAGIAWAEIATDHSVDQSSGKIHLEYFGLQRTIHAIPSSGPTLDLPQCRSSVELAQWATDPASTDRLIAVRQVASLRLDTPPWDRPEDIRTAAEPIFLALRSDAVAEALKTQREAKAAAVATAQRTAELTASLTKGAIERSLGSLLAVGAVAVARATNSLTDNQATKLQWIVAIILITLALWNIMIERPPIFRLARDHQADLGSLNELMSAEDRARILGLQTLASARHQAAVASVAIPTLYLIAAVAAVIVRP